MTGSNDKGAHRRVPSEQTSHQTCSMIARGGQIRRRIAGSRRALTSRHAARLMKHSARTDLGGAAEKTSRRRLGSRTKGRDSDSQTTPPRMLWPRTTRTLPLHVSAGWETGPRAALLKLTVSKDCCGRNSKRGVYERRRGSFLLQPRSSRLRHCSPMRGTTPAAGEYRSLARAWGLSASHANDS
jgi:hypothetical protein